jgi:tRNA 2-thiouridine synthesizing protein E
MRAAIDHQQELAFDENGLLLNAEDWNKNVALIIAKRIGIDRLTTDHWAVIHALRLHYSRFGVAPAMHNICRANGKKSSWVHDLFHTCLDAWRVAGLPDPGEEAKSYLSDM